jgi:predicted kinase
MPAPDGRRPGSGRPAALLIAGPPATGKSTLGAALAPRLGAALLDLDVATGPLVRVISGLAGPRDLQDPVLAGLTRTARYDTLVDLANANLDAGLPVVLVAPFSAERAGRAAWAATEGRLAGDCLLVWLSLPPGELIRRLAGRALDRDEEKLRDPAAYLAGLNLAPPAGPHLALDAAEPTDRLVRAVLERLPP